MAETKAKKVNNKPVAKKATAKKVEKKEVKKASDIFAVIKTGGKQYKVTEGQELLVEKIIGKDKAIFEEVLLVSKAGDLKLGTPLVSGAKVEAKVLSEEEKGKKVVIFKMKAKKRYRRKTGHRQKYTKVLIEKISA